MDPVNVVRVDRLEVHPVYERAGVRGPGGRFRVIPLTRTEWTIAATIAAAYPGEAPAANLMRLLPWARKDPRSALWKHIIRINAGLAEHGALAVVERRASGFALTARLGQRRRLAGHG